VGVYDEHIFVQEVFLFGYPRISYRWLYRWGLFWNGSKE